MTIEEYASLPHATLVQLEEMAKRIDQLTPEEQAFLDAHAPDQVNPCGDCTFCCVAPTIEPHNVTSPLTGPKAAGQPCEYCEVKGGCRVYKSRPSICKGYMCLYALGISPDRPDTTGVCWTFQAPDQPIEGIPGAFLAVGHALDVEEVLKDRRNTKGIIILLAMGAIGVIIRDPKKVVQFCAPVAGVGSGPLLRREVPVDPTDPLCHRWLPDQEQITTFTVN